MPCGAASSRARPPGPSLRPPRTRPEPLSLRLEGHNKTFHGRIDLVLIDVILPLMSGIALAEQIRKRRPVRLLMMSGQADAIAKAAARTPDVRVIPKPLTQDGLLSEVRHVLGATIG